MLPLTFYNGHLAALKSGLDKLLSRKRKLGYLRLFFFLAAISSGWALLSRPWYYPVAAFVALIVIFILVVLKDLRNSESILNIKRLIVINENEILSLGHQYQHFPDGKTWEPADHAYANDLDIFGYASLFQYCNRARSEPGKALFASWLLSPAPAADVRLRQAAIKELSAHTIWRQQLQSFGEAKTLETCTRDNICNWMNEPVQFAGKWQWTLIRFLFPVLSFTLLGLNLAGVVATGILLTGLLFLLVLSFIITRMLMPAYVKLNRVTAELDALSGSMHCIETARFDSPLLKELQSAYATINIPASAAVRQLRKILDRLDYRLNPVVYIPLSAFLCWDLWQVTALEKWKRVQKNNVPGWFAALANFEALNSLGTLSFNHPGWCFPELVEEEATFTANGLGHPLISAAQRVTNNFATSGKGKLNLVTGSNMAGKSTFLRSAGINIVLAMAGGPVCANSFSLSPMRIMSSMRISDNLEENTSTFYAELRKLKSVIEAVAGREKVFLLLDEILRGTNSADRHTGSAALIRQLLDHGAAGMLATHDLELAKLESVYPGRLINYHFDVQVSGEELFFDYKLKEGVCTSMNASLLMRKIGIEV